MDLLTEENLTLEFMGLICASPPADETVSWEVFIIVGDVVGGDKQPPSQVFNYR